MELKNHSAVVTGGASGMGAVTASALAARGARVAVLDINQQAAQDRRMNLRVSVSPVMWLTRSLPHLQ